MRTNRALKAKKRREYRKESGEIITLMGELCESVYPEERKQDIIKVK